MRVGDFGQPRLERLLDDMLSHERVCGSLLFEGPAGLGKEALALEVGRLLNCESGGRCAPRPEFQRAKAASEPRCGSCRKFDRLQHPDLLLVFPVPIHTWEKEPATVAKILEAKAADPYFKPEDFDRPASIQAEVLRDVVIPAVYSRPVEARLKIVVISEAEQITPNMANLLLKTLEEPPDDCLLIVTTSAPERLLPTVLSRCQRLRFVPLSRPWMEPRLQQLHQVTPAQARLAAAVAQGSMLAAARFLRGDLQEVRERAFDILLAAAAGDILALLEMAQATAQEASKRRPLVPLLLQMIGLVLRDALLLSEGAVDAARAKKDDPGSLALINADRAAELQKIAGGLDARVLRGGSIQIETAEREIAGYALTEHTLATLFLDLAGASERADARG